MRPRSALRYALIAGLWGTVAFFFLRSLRGLDWALVASVGINLPLATAALLLGVASRFLLPITWTIALSALENRRMRIGRLLWPYGVSWISRYVPGKLGLIGTRIVMAEHYGYGAASAVVSTGIEIVLQLVLSAILSMALLAIATQSRLPFSVTPVLVMTGALLVLIAPPFLKVIVSLYVRWQKRTAISIDTLSWRTVIACASTLSFMYVLQSCYSILLAESIGMSAHSQWLMFVGSIFLSAIAGMVALFAPNGIGVRELVFVGLLGASFAREQLIVFAVVWRLAETAIDAGFFLVCVAGRHVWGARE